MNPELEQSKKKEKNTKITNIRNTRQCYVQFCGNKFDNFSEMHKYFKDTNYQNCLKNK